MSRQMNRPRFYQFSNVLPGEIISLAIQSDFAKELGLNSDMSINDETLLDNNLIEIFYNVSDWEVDIDEKT